jgi:hypothetical protein
VRTWFCYISFLGAGKFTIFYHVCKIVCNGKNGYTIFSFLFNFFQREDFLLQYAIIAIAAPGAATIFKERGQGMDETYLELVL